MVVNQSEFESVAGLFRFLAEHDFRGASPLYENLAQAAADDRELLALLDPAAPPDRVPYLLFAAVQYLLLGEGRDPVHVFGADPFPVFRAWCLDHRPELERLVSSRVNQTNEVGRCAALAPALAVIAGVAGQPLAVVEVGASAGLNLLFDRYRYVYGPGVAAGPADSACVLSPRLEGALTPPTAMAEVAWRAGLDRQPVDVADDDAVRWLRACIWPGQRWRILQFEQAVAIARQDPPRVIAGDAVDDLPRVVAAAPRDAALCVVHTAVLRYLPDPARFTGMLASLARERPLWWLAGETPGLITELGATGPPAREGIFFNYGVIPLGMAGQRPQFLARAGRHGAWLEWTDPHTGGQARRLA